MVLFREFFAGSIQIIQGGKLLNPGTNNGRVRDAWQGRKGLGWMLSVLIPGKWPPNFHPVFPASVRSVSLSATIWSHLSRSCLRVPGSDRIPQSLGFSSTSHGCGVVRQPDPVVRNPGYYPSFGCESNTEQLFAFGK